MSCSTRELSTREVFHSKKITIAESPDLLFNEHTICVSSGIKVADVVIEEILSRAATLATKKACDGVPPDFSGWAKVVSIRPKVEVLDAQITMALCPNRDAKEQSAAVELQRRFIALAAKSVFGGKWSTASQELLKTKRELARSFASALPTVVPALPTEITLLLVVCKPFEHSSDDVQAALEALENVQHFWWKTMRQTLLGAEMLADVVQAAAAMAQDKESTASIRKLHADLGDPSALQKTFDTSDDATRAAALNKWRCARAELDKMLRLSSTQFLDREAHTIHHIEHLVGAAATLTAKKDADHFLTMLVGYLGKCPLPPPSFASTCPLGATEVHEFKRVLAMNKANLQVDALLGEAAKEAYAKKQILRVRFVDEFFALAQALWQGESALPLASKAVRDFAAWFDDGADLNGDFAPAPTIQPALWRSRSRLQAVVGNDVDVRLVDEFFGYMGNLKDTLGECGKETFRSCLRLCFLLICMGHW